MKMKILGCIVLSVLLLSCTRPNNDDPNTPPSNTRDETPVPAPEKVTTRISAYNDLKPSPQLNNLRIDSYDATYRLGAYNLNTAVSLDKYRAYFYISPNATDNSENFRNIPLTSAARNYIDVNYPAGALVGGIIRSDEAGQWNMPGGGKVTYTANSFSFPYAGSWGVHTTAFYMDPLAIGFSITNPDFTADANGKRWYLRSYGVVGLNLTYPIATTGSVQLIYPIPATYLSVAPDSIEAWNFVNQQWVQKGYAMKSGSNYVKKIDRDGMWNFGVRVKGVYKTFKVRTSDGLPVANAILRIKNDISEIGSARTDVDGNAIFFLPAGETMTFEIMVGWQNVTILPRALTQQIGPFNSNADENITIPSSSPYVMSVKGTASNCGGGTIQNGTVLLASRDSAIFSHIPVRNGQYAGAIIQYNPTPYRITLVNDDNSQSGDTSVNSLRNSVLNTLDLNTCHISTGLFMNYSIDGTNYSITGNIGQSIPVIAGYPRWGTNMNKTLIGASANPSVPGSNNFQFVTSPTTVGVYTGAGVEDMVINDVFYEYDFTKPYVIKFTRYDPLPGGVIEGSLDVWYKESGTSHHVVCSFRVLIK